MIINGFSPSYVFKNINFNEKFVNQSINSITQLLDRLNKKKVKKIIFSSSSSVNNLVSKDINFKQNTFIQSSSKYLIENLIHNYCSNNNVSFNICRISNIFGGNDKFSIINHFTKDNNSKITISNQGNPTRDFIHVDEVSNIYAYLLNTSKFDGIIDVGTGKFLRIREIIEKYNLKNKIIYSKKPLNEVIIQCNDISKITSFYSFKKISL